MFIKLDQTNPDQFEFIYKRNKKLKTCILFLCSDFSANFIKRVFRTQHLEGTSNESDICDGYQGFLTLVL